MAKIDCSELSMQITEIAMNLGSRDHVRSIDDVVTEMQKFDALKTITRADVVNAINEATTAQRQSRDELTKKLDGLKREAKRDVKLKKAITELQGAVKERKSPPPAPPRPKKATPAAILKLVAKKEALQRRLGGVDQDPKLTGLAQSMAKAMVTEGVSDRTELVDAVHRELTDLDPGLSKRAVMDMVSGYGQYRELSKDEASVKLRDLKGQLQQLAKLEDMASGIAPAKTGVERREVSDQERRLIQQVNEAKKRGGFEVTDPEHQLQTALAAVKKRLKNQIADLTAQIADREKIVKTKTDAPTDAEVQALTEQRDALKGQFEDIFGKQGMSDVQRIEVAKKAAEKSIAELERRIDEGDFSPRPKPKTITSPELEGLRSKRDRLRRVYDATNPVSPSIQKARERLAMLEQHIKDGTLPPTQAKPETANPVLGDLQEKTAALRKALSQSDPAIKKRLEKSIGELLRKLEEGDYAPSVSVPKQMSEELGRLEYDRDMLRSEINRRIRDMAPKTFMERASEPFNAARSVITSLDFSAVLRQGGFIGFGHPARAMKGLPTMFRAFASERAGVEVAKDLANRPMAPLAARAGLYMSPVEGAYGLTEKEEAYMSRWAEKIPLVRGSERAYVTFLNKLRADSFDAMVTSLGRNGEATQKEAEAIANYINIATGRGNLYQMEQAALPLATLFFSPRLVMSRFEILIGQPVYRGSARTRKMIATEYARFFIGIGVIYALGLAAGADIEEDPRSSDFGKLRFGKTRLDPLTGLSQTGVFATRIVRGEKKSVISGKVTDLNDPGFGQMDYGDVSKNFFRSKLSPMFGAAWNVRQGENIVGDNTDVTTLEGAKRVASDLTVPMSVRDIIEAMEDQGVSRATAMGILSIFGVSMSVYPEPEDEDEE